ncbi:MAG: hypothetical protein K6U11_13395 [bacterium]|nr:hypothetical protein [bacterium]
MIEHDAEREKKIARCIRCRSEFTADQLRGVSCCPICGDTGQPLSLEDDVIIKINWHELRLLCSFAEKWSEYLITSGQVATADNFMTIYSIIGALQEQYPYFQPLSQGGELHQFIRSGRKLH